MHISRAGFTCTGNHRSENQDTYCFNGRHCVLADGMGGLPNGKAAALSAAQMVLEIATKTRSISEAGKPEITSMLININQQFRDANPQSGSTICLLSIFSRNFYVASIGDSRAYLYRRGSLFQLTTDQNAAVTFASNLNSNILTNYLGKLQITPPSYVTGLLEKGDLFLMTSDGAHSVGNNILQSALSVNTSVDETSQHLKSILNQFDPQDNYTVVLIGVDIE